MEDYGSSKSRSPSPISTLTSVDLLRRLAKRSDNIIVGKTVKITVEKQHTKDVTFNVKRNIPLGKLMVSYCLQMGFSYNAFRFTYLNKQVKDFQTPLDLEMEDVDVIYCWSDQLGA